MLTFHCPTVKKNADHAVLIVLHNIKSFTYASKNSAGRSKGNNQRGKYEFVNAFMLTNQKC